MVEREIEGLIVDVVHELCCGRKKSVGRVFESRAEAQPVVKERKIRGSVVLIIAPCSNAEVLTKIQVIEGKNAMPMQCQKCKCRALIMGEVGNARECKVEMPPKKSK
jgi:hypothetical protein